MIWKIFIGLVLIVLTIALAGYLKFGVMADDVYVTDQNGEHVKYNDLQKKIKAGQHPEEWDVPFNEFVGDASSDKSCTLDSVTVVECRYIRIHQTLIGEPAIMVKDFDGRRFVLTLKHDQKKADSDYENYGYESTEGPYATLTLTRNSKSQSVNGSMTLPAPDGEERGNNYSIQPSFTGQTLTVSYTHLTLPTTPYV